MNFTRVFDLIAFQLTMYPQARALNGFQNGKWIPVSTLEMQTRTDAISCWLIENGFSKGQRIAFIPRWGSPDWIMIDMACQQIGLVIVPIHPTSSPEEMSFMMNETEVVACITADSGLFYKVKTIMKNLPSLKKIFHLEVDTEGYFTPIKLKVADKKTFPLLEQQKNQVEEDALLSIMYTSGTSGTPKGAMLTHRNVVSSIKSILPVFSIKQAQRVLSFLPFSHIFERTTCYAYLGFGVNIYFSLSQESLANDFLSVRPHSFTAVPKVLERMYDYLIEYTGEKMGVRKIMMKWAIQVGEKYQDRKKADFLFRLKLFIARLLVLKPWCKALGGKVDFIVVGAAALDTRIGRLFSAAGINILSGYGMTEASPFIAVNRPQLGLNRFGTVGIPLPGVDVHIHEPNENGEGEILVRGLNIMKGYFNRPALNKEVFTEDGWFRTGDIGKKIEPRFLMITDRKKDIFKTSAGIYIAPLPLENHFNTSLFITQSMIIGFNRPFVAAVIVPNFSALKSWCDRQGIHWTSPQFMIHNIKIKDKMQQEVDRLNEDLQNFKRIKKFLLSDTEWTAETGDLTTSQKLIRGKLLEKYKNQIEKMYN